MLRSGPCAVHPPKAKQRLRVGLCARQSPDLQVAVADVLGGGEEEGLRAGGKEESRKNGSVVTASYRGRRLQGTRRFPATNLGPKRRRFLLQPFDPLFAFLPDPFFPFLSGHRPDLLQVMGLECESVPLPDGGGERGGFQDQGVNILEERQMWGNKDKKEGIEMTSGCSSSLRNGLRGMSPLSIYPLRQPHCSSNASSLQCI